MRHSLILLAILFLAVGSCSSKKGLSGPEQRKRVNDFRYKKSEEKSIAGFWQEYKRTVSKKRMAERPMMFTDTLKIVFRGDSTTRFYDLQGRISGGKFMYKDGLYHLGNGQTFSSMERLGDTLRLGNDGASFSYLRKVNGFYTKPFGPERTDVLDEENDPLDALFLQGKWKVYKKEDKGFTGQKIYLKTLDIKESNEDGTFDVTARYHNNQKVYNDAGTLEITGNQMRLTLKKRLDEYKIIKAKSLEMILQYGGVRYYLKNLSK